MELHDTAMSQYMEKLTSQIRNKRAKYMVKQEIQSHIEEQVHTYVQNGLESTEALERAVKDMGDPVEVGIEMDRIHRPRSGWKLLLLIAGFSAAGLLAQYFSFYRISGELTIYPMVDYLFQKQCIYTVFGLILMVAVYYVDYSVISKYGRQIGVLSLLFLIFICSGPLSLPVVNGSHAYIKCILYLFIPVYGGILYHCRTYRSMGIVLGFLWIAAAFWVGVTQIGGGLGVTLDMAAVCYMMLLLAVGKGWFRVKKNAAALALMIGLPAAAAGIAIAKSAPYQIMRLKVMLNPESYAQTVGYQASIARELVKNLAWYGAERNTNLSIENMPAGALPDVHYNYIMLQIASVWGILAVCVLAGSLLALLGYLLFMIHRQKNQIGQVIGFGCMMVLAVETVRNLFNNFGFYTLSTGGLPFFSYGQCHTLAVYTLLGVLLSIYRYQDLIWERLPHQKERKKGILARLGNYQIRIERL